MKIESLEQRLVLTGSIQGVVFHDLNGDGVQDVGEAGIAGATVFLDADLNGVLNGSEVSTATLADGSYEFTGLAAGNYTVAQVLPDGWLQTAAGSPGVGRLGEVTDSVAAAGMGTILGSAWVNGDIYQVELVGADDQVWRINPQTGAAVLAFNGPGALRHIAFDGTNFWGTDTVNDKIYQFQIDGTLLATFNSPAVDPSGISWDGSHLWVADIGTDRIYKLDPGNPSAPLTSFAAPDAAVQGLAFDGQHLWASGLTADRIYQIDRGTGLEVQSFAAALPDGSKNAASLTFDGQHLWSSDSGGRHFLQVDPGGDHRDVTVADGAVAAIGNFQLAAAAGQVFNDLDGDGSQIAGEEGLASWRVFLDYDADGQYDVGEQATLTDAAGNYSLTLRPGTSRVTAELRAPGWTQTSPTAGFHTVVASSGQALAAGDFGARQVGFGPVGAETLVNAPAPGLQGHHFDGFQGSVLRSVGLDAAGNYVVVWGVFGQGTPGDGVYARRYSADGTPLGAEFRVSTIDGGDVPHVAVANNGNFVVTYGGTKARLYNAAGATIKAEFTATTKTAARIGDVVMDANGNFAVLFRTQPKWGPTWWVQRYSATGAKLGNAINVGDSTNNQGEATIAMNDSGAFVVAFQHGTATGRVQVQRFNAAGQKQGGLFTVAGSFAWPAVDINDAGDFVVVYTAGALPVTSQTIMYAQIYNANGTLRGGPVVVEPFANGGHGQSVQMNNDEILVTYQNNDPQGQGQGIRAVRITTAGAPIGSMFVVNSTLAGNQNAPSVALNDAGQAVIVWSGNGPGEDSGVFFQRYAPAPAPVGGASLARSSSAGGEGLAALSFAVESSSDGGGAGGQRRSRSGGSRQADRPATASGLGDPTVTLPSSNAAGGSGLSGTGGNRFAAHDAAFGAGSDFLLDSLLPDLAG